MDALIYEELPAVYRTPPEILEEIFLYCWHDNSVYTLLTEAPFNLVSTCHRWRQIATFNLPIFWSTFHVTFTQKACKPPLPTLKLWLERSRKLPLSFSLIYRGRNSFDGGDNRSTVIEKMFAPLELLSEHLVRWRDVYVDLSDLPHNTRFRPSSLLEEELMLETFAVRTFKPHPRHNTHSLIPNYMNWISKLAESSPNLYKFDAYGDGPITRLFGINTPDSVPWIRLTILTLEHVSETLALHILQSSARLLECTFADLGRYIDWIANLPLPQLRDNIVVPRLTTLRITAEGDIDSFWDRLIIPSLQELKVYMLPGSRQWHQGDALVQFFQRSGLILDAELAGLAISAQALMSVTRGPPISRISLRNCNIPSRSLGSRVKLLSESLRELIVIDKATIDNELVKLLTLPDLVDNGQHIEATDEQESILCPKLEYLTLVNCINATDGLTSQMIKSRLMHNCETLRQLKSVLIGFSQSGHAEDFYQLEKMLKEGLNGGVSIKKGVTLARRKTQLSD
ncbi:hypothetical protein BDP27DRAFT_1424549 [Rhodocollybia butyracea]|uniref:F-box domain-containing protein n=1 Tax=Rhodocollybia butyracea TaxID=206335 RepID=A0A9P5PKR1_9AGAR|nr:hypothetical protein BDP27DRAFT_1424549 [Rhodocollybia butyracea]